MTTDKPTGRIVGVAPPGRGLPGIPKPRQTEADFQQAVIDAARAHGWLVAHFRTAPTRGGGWATPVAADGAGFPDLVLVRDRTIFAELKTDRGRPSDLQQHWLDRLQTAGAEAYLWRPRDWDHIDHALRRRHPPPPPPAA